MKKFETIEIVEKLVGRVQPTGDHGVDIERLKNLDDLIELIQHLVAEIEDVAEYNTAAQNSMKALGERAYKYRNELTAYEG